MNMIGDKAAPFRNRKGTLCQNVMVACDFDLNFTFISCGWEGSATDAKVLRSALLKGFKVHAGKFYLVDGGYANTPFSCTISWCSVPFERVWAWSPSTPKPLGAFQSPPCRVTESY
jgi:hypothetical protein